MVPPFISYVSFDRLGLVEKNLNDLLKNTGDDFEMHFIASNSKDNTWDYMQSLTDPRIKSIIRLPVNFYTTLGAVALVRQPRHFSTRTYQFT